jgi:hypothetical protein
MAASKEVLKVKVGSLLYGKVGTQCPMMKKRITWNLGVGNWI